MRAPAASDHGWPGLSPNDSDTSGQDVPRPHGLSPATLGVTAPNVLLRLEEPGVWVGGGGAARVQGRSCRPPARRPALGPVFSVPPSDPASPGPLATSRPPLPAGGAAAVGAVSEGHRTYETPLPGAT